MPHRYAEALHKRGRNALKRAKNAESAKEKLIALAERIYGDHKGCIFVYVIWMSNIRSAMVYLEGHHTSLIIGP